MRVFISWSGRRSKEIAKTLNDWIPFILQNIKPWFSDTDISKGDRALPKLSDELSNIDVGIICVTPENINEPWINFEAGAISKLIDRSMVCPIVYGIDSKNIKGPLGQFQATQLTYDDMKKFFNDLNKHMGSESISGKIVDQHFDTIWPHIIEDLKLANIFCDNVSVPDMYGVISSKYELNDCGEINYIEAGYDTHELFTLLLNNCKKRFMIFGRANRKLFDKDHYRFFENLKGNAESGFVFKCLFLNPQAPEEIIQCAHQDPKFIVNLKLAIGNANKVFQTNNLNAQDYARFYSFHRNISMVIVDDIVLFSYIKCSVTNKIEPLTDSSFYVCNCVSKKGIELINYYHSTWNDNSEDFNAG